MCIRDRYVAHGVMSDRNPRERQPNHLTIFDFFPISLGTPTTLISLDRKTGLWLPGPNGSIASRNLINLPDISSNLISISIRSTSESALSSINVPA